MSKVSAAVLLALLSFVSPAAAQPQTLAGAAAAAAKAKQQPAAPVAVASQPGPVTCDALLQHPLAWWLGSIPTRAERDQLAACLSGSGQQVPAAPSVPPAPSAAVKDTHPANWNLMNA